MVVSILHMQDNLNLDKFSILKMEQHIYILELIKICDRQSKQDMIDCVHLPALPIIFVFLLSFSLFFVFFSFFLLFFCSLIRPEVVMTIKSLNYSTTLMFVFVFPSPLSEDVYYYQKQCRCFLGGFTVPQTLKKRNMKDGVFCWRCSLHPKSQSQL